jgi:hypothetical protein
MRRGYDGIPVSSSLSTATNVTVSTDVMMFLNVAVAITCFAFCWTMLVVGFKGWVKSRTHPAVSFLPSV